MYGAAIFEPPVQPLVPPVTEPLLGDSPAELYAAIVYVCMLQPASPLTVPVVPVTVALTVLPSYTRYPVTVPLATPQLNETELLVVPVTDGLPGAPGAP